MGKYDFDTVTDRSHTFACKWDLVDGDLPMWVADMDFKTAPEIIEAITKRAEHGVYGYTYVPDEWYDAYISWWKNRHGLNIEKEWLAYVTGVIPVLSSSVRKLTTPAEKVVIQTPVYNIFFNCIQNNGREVLENRLVYRDGQFEMDWDDLEEKLADPRTTLMILCNPQNPTGRIWTAEELERIGGMCYRNGVKVISDEIHCDITDPGEDYIPFASVSDICRDISVTAIAPTKAFNIAGIMTAAVMVPNPHIRNRIIRAINTDEVAEPGVFSINAAIAAFTRGEDWLNELREYIFSNKQRVLSFVEKEIPDIHIVPSRATYLLWLDMSRIDKNADEICRHLIKTEGLVLAEGSKYGENGRSFLRMNIAAPSSLVEDGLNRLKRGIAGYEAV